MDMSMGASRAPRMPRSDALREDGRSSLCWGIDAMKEMINLHIESVGTVVEPPLAAVPISSVHRRNARSLTSVPRPTCFCSLATRVVPFGDTVNAIPAIVHMAVGVCIRLPLSRAVRCTWHGEASARPACSPLGVMSARTGLGVESG